MVDYKQIGGHGIIIFADGWGYAVEKHPVPTNPRRQERKHFESIAMAEAFAISLLEEEKKIFKAIIRFDRGLGVEYKTVNNIRCDNEDQAEKIAVKLADMDSNPKIKVSEIKIRKQN
jgi:hypothetical protein